MDETTQEITTKVKSIKIIALAIGLVCATVISYYAVGYFVFDKTPVLPEILPTEVEIDGLTYLKISKECVLTNQADGDPRSLDYWKKFVQDNFEQEGFLFHSRLATSVEMSEDQSTYWQIICVGEKGTEIRIHDAIPIWNDHYGENNEIVPINDKQTTPKHYDRTGNVDAPTISDNP